MTRVWTILSAFLALAAAQEPAAIYDGGLGDGTNGTIALRIGNGGAGQSGLVKGAYISMIPKQ
jgi:hypothetical protein